MPSKDPSQASFDAFNVDPVLNELRMAYHEAGHAVATWALAIPLAELRIGTKDGYSERAESFASISGRLGEAEARKQLAIIQLAGGAAQQRWNATTYLYGCDCDRANARSNSERYYSLTGHAADECFDAWSTDADAIVAEHWPKVVALADVLLRHKVLDGHAARLVIENA